MTDLKWICLSGCTGVGDISPLVGPQKLRTLDLSSCPNVSDVGPLKSLTGLERVNLLGCEKVTDLSPLREAVQSGCRVYVNSRLTMQLKKLVK